MQALLDPRPATEFAHNPRIFYRPIYDPKHRISVRKAGRVLKGKVLQKGIREKLLCDSCELRLSRYEKHMRETLFGGNEKFVLQKNEKLIVTGLDYQKVRIFFLSLIWRMGVARGHPMWQSVKLGLHEERLRKMVFSENPGEPWEYGFHCIVPLFDGQLVEDLILEPDCKQTDKGRIYRVVIGGCVYLFHISNQRLAPQMEERLIQKNGSWILALRDARQINFLSHRVR